MLCCLELWNFCMTMRWMKVRLPYEKPILEESFCIAFNAFNKPLRLLHNRTFSTKSQELAIIGEYQLPEGCRYSVSRSGCEVKSHHRGLMKTSNFRREIRKTYYRNDPVKYDLDFCHLLNPSYVHALSEDQLLL